MLTLSAASAIMVDQLDVVEIITMRLGEYASAALSSIGHIAYEHPSELVTAVFMAVLAVATIKLWRSTNSLWKAAERQLSHLERTTEVQLRSDVFGKARWTQYRFMMGGPVGFRDGQLVGCEEGNESI
jgi:hypothetical protein